MPSRPTPSRYRLFEAHGVHLTGGTGDQVYGYCPFSNKDDKFYINANSLLWDSKTAGLSGNASKFLHETALRYARDITPSLMARLARDRGLPIEAFAPWSVGWTGQAYSIPIHGISGKTKDIRTFTPGRKMFSTPGAEVGLFGAERLATHADWPVYLCEGEWDAIALHWLLRHLQKPGHVVALPGAGTFKPGWVPWFAGRRVHTLFDHDVAGEKGEQLIIARLKTSVQLLTFVHWPDKFPEGFDVRDWIIAGAVKTRTPKRCWRALTELFKTTPRQTYVDVADGQVKGDTPDPGTGALPVVERRPTKWKDPPTLGEVYAEFKRWLFLDSTDAISLMLAVAVSQQIDGEPVWMFIVGSPGSCKTETLSSLSWIDHIYMTSSVTPHSLISGASWKDNVDPSLIPRLNGKVMVIKDFTSIMGMRDAEKEEIFGILRDAYDGKCGKEFGNGVIRRYESRFTIIAAVTPSIHTLSASHTALGERFLKFSIGDNLVHKNEDEIIERAISNIHSETEMRDDLADVVSAFLMHRVPTARIPADQLPTLPISIRTRIVALARFGARMRGTVARDTYRNDIITGRPSAEVGSRLGKQLAKLAQSLAVIHGRDHVTLNDYRLVRKVMMDTVPQRIDDLLRHVIEACPKVTDSMSVRELSTKSKYPTATITRLMQDLAILNVMQRGVNRTESFGGHLTSTWTASDYIREIADRANVFTPSVKTASSSNGHGTPKLMFKPKPR